MNYAVVILAFVFLLAFSYWFISGRHYYIGPRSEAQVVNGGVVAKDMSPDHEKAVNASGREI
jgi:uncharacterized membrane protein YqiK